jgi:hypothetical protein
MPKARKTEKPLTPIDYYKRPDRITWWKRRLSVTAFFIALAWACGLRWDFYDYARWQQRVRGLASHGPLSRVHAPWDFQCEACHASSGSIGMSQARWASQFVGGSSQSDARCQQCHIGPIHHATQFPRNPSCASCHHEHNGRDASLVKIADRHCTQCHGNLELGHTIGEPNPDIDQTVPRFDAKSHPEFRAKAKPDPGSLKFNHALHLTLGMASDGGGPVKSLGMLAKSDQARYLPYAQGTKRWIQLDCAACHRLEEEDLALPVRPGHGRSSGAYLLPIKYENQCRACHPLDFDPALPKLKMEHRHQPAEVHKSLWNTYAGQYISPNPALSGRRIPLRPLPGRPETPERQEARQEIERQVRAAERNLFGPKKCGECHVYDWGPASPVQVKATKVPEVWLPSALFDHSSHRAVRCLECHERAFPQSKSASRHSTDVLLPSIKDCVKCHSPSHLDGDGISTVGGASFDCTECHRYHNADAPLQGRGAARRAPKLNGDIQRFLFGNP